MKMSEMKISGFDHKPLPNRLMEPEKSNGWLAVILPGIGYTMDMPILYMIRSMLVSYGCTTLNINPRSNLPEFEALNDFNKFEWLGYDAKAGIKAGLTTGEYKGIVLIGKSLGTMAISQAVEYAEAARPTIIGWLTPLFRFPVVAEACKYSNSPQFVLGGGADPSMNMAKYKSILEKNKNVKGHIVANANHSLETSDAGQQRFAGMLQGLAEFEDFVKPHFEKGA